MTCVPTTSICFYCDLEQFENKLHTIHIANYLMPSILLQIIGQEKRDNKKDAENGENLGRKEEVEEGAGEVKKKEKKIEGEGEGVGERVDKENRFNPVRADDLLRALESVTAAVFRCSHVKAFLVSSDVIGAPLGDLVFLSDASSPTAITGSSSTMREVSKR